MSKAVKTFYLLHGDDDFGLEQELAAIRKRMGDGPNADLNTDEFDGTVDEFDGTVASVPEVLNAVSSYPFLADRRLVIVRGMLGWITRKGAGETGKQAVEALLNALPTLPETARLVFVERGALAENSKLVKLARENPAGYEKLFASPSDATGWIMRRAKDAYETEIQPAAAAALAEVTGHDLRSHRT